MAFLAWALDIVALTFSYLNQRLRLLALWHCTSLPTPPKSTRNPHILLPLRCCSAMTDY